jgi:hypothetical protein
MDPLTLLALFGPAIKDGTMALIKKWTGDSAGKPANTTELIQLMEAETKQLEARIHAGDTEGTTYPWVIAVIKLQRPIVVYFTFITFLFMSAYSFGSVESRTMVGNLCSTVVFWLFGERYNLKSSEK